MTILTKFTGPAVAGQPGGDSATDVLDTLNDTLVKVAGLSVANTIPAPVTSQTIVTSKGGDVNEYDYPSRLRSYDKKRMIAIVQNVGLAPVQLGLKSTLDANYFNGPDSWSITLAPGDEYVAASGSSVQIWARPAVRGAAVGFTLSVFTVLGA